MALISCKECYKEISDKADVCPHCGVPKPAIPYELERMYRERDSLEKDEREHVAIYEKCYDLMDESFIGYMLNRKRNKELKEKLDEHVALAMRAQSRKLDKQNEISKYEFNLVEERRKGTGGSRTQ